jgi:uncharacterized protein (DUF2235 family)
MFIHIIFCLQMARDLAAAGTEQSAKRLAQRRRLRSISGGGPGGGGTGADPDGGTPWAGGAAAGGLAGGPAAADVMAARATAMRSATERVTSEKSAAAVLGAVLSMAQCGVLSWAYFSTGEAAELSEDW